MILHCILVFQTLLQALVVAGAAALMIHDRRHCPFADTYFLVVVLILARRVSAYMCSVSEATPAIQHVNNIWLPMTISGLLVLLTIQMFVYVTRPVLGGRHAA